MKSEAWQKFSFIDFLKPSDGWRTKDAIFSTYSFDLSVVVVALLALTGCELDYGRKGSRVELVKALDALRGKVCVLAQQGRGTIPNAQLYVLKLLDRFVKTIILDESKASWHPKIALCRYCRLDDESDEQWRLWVGSMNLVKAMNWEAGVGLVSRNDGKGQLVNGIPTLAKELSKRANLKTLDPESIENDLAQLTWESTANNRIERIELYGPQLKEGFPMTIPNARSVFVISPFLSTTFVRDASTWGKDAERTLVSNGFELHRLWASNNQIFSGFDRILTQPVPELPGQDVEDLREELTHDLTTIDGEDVPPTGLHAKLFYLGESTQRRLVLASANATRRGWNGSNYEVVAELSPSKAAVESLEDFIDGCVPWSSSRPISEDEEDEDVLKVARRTLSSWSLKQQVIENEVLVFAASPPPIEEKLRLEVALMNDSWNEWPTKTSSIALKGSFKHRSEFVQLRLSINEKMCRWLQTAPCDPPPDDERDRAVIARYIDPRMFLLWLRSILADEPKSGGGDWDGTDLVHESTISGKKVDDLDMSPTIEEVLRAWARDPGAFKEADRRVSQYVSAFQERALELDDKAALKVLEAFQQMWNTVASELR
jgi:hypothetical protein